MKILLKFYEVDLVGKGCMLVFDCICIWIFVQNVDVNYVGIVKVCCENFLGQGLIELIYYIVSIGIEGWYVDLKIYVLFDVYVVKGLQLGQVIYLYVLFYFSLIVLYGVIFEWGIFVEYGDCCYFFISGMVSIDYCGEVVYVGDVWEQIWWMWENVEKLFEEGKVGFEDVVQMIVYLWDVLDYLVVCVLFVKCFFDILI